jgi:hypothetical protein
MFFFANSRSFLPACSCGVLSFRCVRSGVDIRTNERIAIKVENRTTKYPQLLDEYAVYRAVAKGVGVPSAIWCGSNTNVHIMVMDLLGDSLETLYNNCGRKFSLKTITMLAIQLLHRIEHHHNHHYLHRVNSTTTHTRHTWVWCGWSQLGLRSHIPLQCPSHVVCFLLP